MNGKFCNLRNYVKPSTICAMRKITLAILMFFGVLSCSPYLWSPEWDQKTETENKKENETVPEFETSYEAVANMGVGWNLGNTLESVWTGDDDGRNWRLWETGWGQAVTRPQLMTMMRDAGFGAIRVPVSWGVHMDADGKVYQEWMNRVNEVVDYVLGAGLYCIINVHHDTGADEELAWLVASPEGYQRAKDRYEHLWEQIAERFKDYDQRLLFESFNEMLDEGRSWCFASLSTGYDAEIAAGAYKAINDYAQSFVDVVRATGGNNSTRNLIVNTYGACNGAGDWNPHLLDPLRNMRKPSDSVSEHIIFQVHSYPMIDDLAAMEKEVTTMLDDLERYLEPLGGPVIVGEWGTFSENPSLENYCYYSSYFVSEAKKRGIGTFHWMGISDGIHRGIPCFNEPEKTEAIIKGYHGEGYSPIIPVIDDFDITYKVTYHKLWSELNLYDSRLDLNEYQGITLKLSQAPASGVFHIKVYGEEDGKEQSVPVSGATVTVSFNASDLGASTTAATLQCLKEGSHTVTIESVSLIKRDGTLVDSTPSVFWGCEVEIVVNK